MKKRRRRTEGLKKAEPAENTEETSLKAGVRLWVDVGGASFLGRGRIELLKRIDRDGSISAAARSLNMSYRTAWKHIESMNRITSSPLVTTEIGGSHGGGSRLSPLGKRLIEIFERSSDDLETQAKRMEAEIVRLIRNDEKHS